MLIQIKIILSFTDMWKEYLWDCPFPGQHTRTFYRIWQVFIKSGSKSKALIHYPMGCPRRHRTPDLFISSFLHCMDPADPWGKPSGFSRSFMCHHIVCDTFHGIHGVQEMQVSVMMTQNAQLVHRLLSGVLKLGLHSHHGSGKGDVAQPQPIHWPLIDSLKNSHTVRVKCAGALSCWNDTRYIIPLLLGSGIT